jgi:hypothetical protein
VNDQDPRVILALRLRDLREHHWPRKVNQSQLAAALGGDGNRPASVPLVSSWESRTNPAVPPVSRIEDIATFFATPRSFDGRTGRLLSPDEMTVQERTAREALLEELTRLRREALAAPGPSGLEAAPPDATREIAESFTNSFYRFKVGQSVTIVCARLPQSMLERMPYTDPIDPDFIALYRYSDPDALLELFGHLRAANPTSRVRYSVADQLTADDYSGHLIALGGVDWNDVTNAVLDRLDLPVRQVSDWDKEGGVYFEVTEEGGRTAQHRPRLEKSVGGMILREDVALFVRAVSPFNRKRTVTICNGMYGRGTYGAARALTDERFRDRNMEYIQTRFSDSEAFCILTRVTVENGVTLTPDWTLPETRLFEWPGPQ